MLSSAKRITCNDTFKKHLEEYLISTARTLVKIEEKYVDEAFKNAKYDYSGIEFDRSSIIESNPEKVRVGEAAEYKNSEDQEREITHTQSVGSTEGLELMKTELSSWNIHGGLSAEYHVGASTGIGYMKRQSESVKRISGKKILLPLRSIASDIKLLVDDLCQTINYRAT